MAEAHAHGPRNASEIVGHRVASSTSAGVTAFVNMAVIRSHPVGARLGPVFAVTPGWRDVIGAIPAASAPVEPLRAADWVVVYGPSLVKGAGLVAIARTALSDPAVDSTLTAVSRSGTRGGTFDTGVPGVFAVRANPDRTERVLMRVQPGIVIMAPPDKAAELARMEQHATFPMRARPGEAIRIVIKEPSQKLGGSAGSFPTNMSELRVWVDAHDDGSADGYLEGDCDTHEHAEDARTFFDGVITQNGNMLMRVATHGLFATATTSTSGSTVKMHVPATRDQVEALVALLEASLGVQAHP